MTLALLALLIATLITLLASPIVWLVEWAESLPVGET